MPNKRSVKLDRQRRMLFGQEEGGWDVRNGETLAAYGGRREEGEVPKIVRGRGRSTL